MMTPRASFDSICDFPRQNPLTAPLNIGLIMRLWERPRLHCRDVDVLGEQESQTRARACFQENGGSEKTQVCSNHGGCRVTFSETQTGLQTYLFVPHYLIVGVYEHGHAQIAEDLR